MAETRRLGNVATRVLFENERVKVWEMLLEPGESSDLHEHTISPMPIVAVNGALPPCP